MTVHQLPVVLLFALLPASPLLSQTADTTPERLAGGVAEVATGNPVPAPHTHVDSTPGRVAGRVIDAETGEGIPGAVVAIEGTLTNTRTDLSGRYVLTGVLPGLRTVTVRMIGYAPKSVTAVAVQAGAPTLLDVTLSAAAFQMAGIEVTAEAERGSVSLALEEQRTASHIISAVSAEQIKRSPDSDAGQAVQRVSGVTVQDGRYVLVRGLGERYTTTSLNNARLPSPEPERKVVPLDLFPSSLLESIVTSKTFTPEQPGDFSGAQVDLRTREFPLTPVLNISLSGGMNDAVVGHDVVRAPRVGSEWLGFAGAARDLPAIARTAGDLSGFTPAQLNTLAGSFRDSWSANLGPGAPNGSLGLSLGGEHNLGSVPLGYIASFTYSTSEEIRRQEQRARADYGGVPDSAVAQDERYGSSGTAGVLWGGLLNFTAQLGPANRISFDNTFTHGGENQATQLIGFDEQFDQNFSLTQLTFTERLMRSNQLSGEHLLGGRHVLSWGVTSAAVRRYEPDRSGLIYETSPDPVTGELVPTAWWGQQRSAFRTFSDLHESSLEGRSALDLRFGAPEHSVHIKFGGSYRQLWRTADTRLFELRNLGLSDAERAQSAETIFDGTYASQGLLFPVADAFAGQYKATDHLSAGFAQFDVPLSDRIGLLGGARFEYWALDLTTRTVAGQVVPVLRRNLDVLPALALNFRLAANHTLRLSASQTLSRPEYRELSPVPYRDVLGGVDMQGDTALQRALIQNYDARWEWYPHPGEIVSVALFAKRFHQPIERVFVATTGASTLSFVNANGANNYGVELELRKQLLTLTPALAPVSLFGNATFMRSRIEPGNEGISALTNTDRPMAGQSSYVVNAGIGYTSLQGRFAATALYNVIGPRIAEAGTGGIPDAYEQARPMLDLSAQLTLASSFTLRVDAKNLLDTPVEVRQGSVVRSRYRTGRVFSAGLSWQP